MKKHPRARPAETPAPIESSFSETEKRTRLAMEAAGIGAWQYDTASDSFWRSPRHDRIFGYERLPKWTRDMFRDHILPEDRAAVWEEMRRSAAERRECRFECRIRREDGEVRWILGAGSHTYGADGKVLRVSGITVDITECRRAEGELRERRRLAESLHDHLQQILASAKFHAAVLGRSDDGLARQAAAEIGRLLDEGIAASRSLCGRRSWASRSAAGDPVSPRPGSS